MQMSGLQNDLFMKQIRIMMALWLFALMAHADSKFLVFQAYDGTETPVETENLIITFGDGNLVTNKDVVLPLSEINKMFFSNTVGINDILADEADGEVSVFLPSGVECGTYHNMNIARASLHPGVYILKSRSKSVKVIIK